MENPVEFMKFFLSVLVGRPVPTFRFQREQFAKLIRERKNKQPIQAPEKEPEVTFEEGPIDGVLGRFDRKTNHIFIDVLENFLAGMLESQSGNYEEVKREFDKRLTKTLAHEGRHWHIEKLYGWKAMLDKTIVFFLILLIGSLSYWLLLRGLGMAIDFAAHKVWALNHMAGILIDTAMVLVAIGLATIGFRYYLNAWKILASAVSYKICFTERTAREAGEKALKDPRWDNVIEIN